ncbi:trace amine-associated receptor 9 [Macrosteles quadrilineatus]|uniref:trace amine-associated receptor 9 n=1 Tax=Macrosteles quadrilineatus TaxID=74068 RepID=UPI0023E28B28|nr:trace amine-associated receptor 9 [Macrosteles quadrilineatus]
MRSISSKSSLLVPPSLHNSSCTHPRYGPVGPTASLGGLVQGTIILTLFVGIIIANMLVIIVINSRRYSKYIHAQPRYLLTSLAGNDLAIGLLITPFGVLPAVYGCWPYSDMLCQIQALLRGALTQQSAAILICMAVDRYNCMLHPVSYHKHSNKKGCMALLCLTLVTSLTVFSTLVLPRGSYYFNASGLAACDPFYTRASLRILAACTFYFPTTMVLMYCYGSAFHVNKLRLKRSVSAASPQQEISTASMEKLMAHERRLSTNASRTMAAMSLGFIVMVTPWTIQEVVVACTGSKMPPFLDFMITWLALSNSFWNPFLYWLLNNNFRRISKEIFLQKVLCRKPKKPSEAAIRCCTSTGPIAAAIASRSDLEGMSERYWGEILERTVSSSSLQAMSRGVPPPLPLPTAAASRRTQ